MGICQHSLRSGDVVLTVCMRGDGHDLPHEGTLPYAGPFEDADDALDTTPAWARIAWSKANG
jgi:hypothetical protein